MRIFFLIVSSLLLNYSQAQNRLYFSPAPNIDVFRQSSLLHNAFAGGINFPVWSSVDLNGDGLEDLFMFDKTNDRILTFVNNGSVVNAFQYAPEYRSRFPFIPRGSWARFFDYNCDGKNDFFTLSQAQNGIAVYRNDYSVGSGLQFTQVSTELTETWSGPSPINIFASTGLLPALVDVDNDGDMDILGFNSIPDGRVAYHKNLSKELYGHCDSLRFHFDSRCWGDFALCLGANAVCSFNAACPPPFPNPGNLSYELARLDDTIATLHAIDLDGDGDKELLIGDLANPTSLMIRNGGSPSAALADSQDVNFPSYDIPVMIYDFVNHFTFDLDNDGTIDLLASAGQLEDKAGNWFYKNINTNSVPVFQHQYNNFMQATMIDAGQGAIPVFFDYDADGLKDLLIGYGHYVYPSGVASGFQLWRNTGTMQQPAFTFVTDDYAGLASFNLRFPVCPAFGDLDNDGDMDLIVGDQQGNVHYFQNTAGAGNPATFAAPSPNYMGIDVGNGATPQIFDLDRDGLPDLVIGEQNGTLNFYKNTGSSANPFYNAQPTIDTLGNISVAAPLTSNGFSVPFLFEKNNKYHLIVSNMSGYAFYYDNIDNNLNGAFNMVDTVINQSLGVRTSNFNLSVSGGDINSDGLTDLVFGLFSGGVQIYYGSESTQVEFTGKQEIHGTLFPNPAGKTFTISGSAPNARIRIFSTSMIELYNRNHTLPAIITTGDFPPGIYWVEVASGAERLYKKIILNGHEY